MNEYSMFEDPNELKLNSSYAQSPSGVQGGAEGLAGSAAMSGGNPAIMAGLVGLKMLQAHKAQKQKEKDDRYRAQISTSNNMQSALSKLANIGSALKL